MPGSWLRNPPDTACTPARFTFEPTLLTGLERFIWDVMEDETLNADQDFYRRSIRPSQPEGG
jgi:hypothetical protein